MKLLKRQSAFWVLLMTCLSFETVRAGEDLFAHLKLAEPLPKGAIEVYQIINERDDKGLGTYRARNYETEIEFGLTNKFTLSVGLGGQGIKSQGLFVDGYLPKDNEYGFKFSGFELKMAYNFLSVAEHSWGVTGILKLEKSKLDPHSGFGKHNTSVSGGFNLQKYLFEGQMTLANQISIESTKATRGDLEGLPEDFEWPLFAEVELEFTARSGLSYRFFPRWFASAEIEFQQEYETEVNIERETIFAGPSIHYGGKTYWFTLTWLGQVKGRGESFEGQPTGYHLIEKTRNEYVAKFGFNF